MAQAAAQPAGRKQTVSYRTVLRSPDVQVLSVSRAMYKLAGATLSYGTMVFLAREGANQFEISLVSASQYVAALLFGFQGGMIADSMPKRLAISAGFAFQAALCIMLPLLWGTSVANLLLLVFLSSLIGQVVGPGVKATVALVSSDAEIATTGALISVIGSTASAMGSSLLAPLLMKVANFDVLLYVVGGLYLIGAVRAIKLPEDPEKSAADLARERKERENRMSLRQTLYWLFGDRQLFSIILLGAIVTALYEAFTTMMPLYVADVLGADPANAIYIFAPASIGFLIGTVGGPWLMAAFGERRLLVASVVLSSAGIIAFGMIGIIGPFFAPFSPLRLLEPFGVELSTSVLAAGVLAIPTNLGSSLAGACVQVYINRNVANSSQGRLFGSQEVLKNVLNIVTVLATGAAATLFSLQAVLILTPAIVVVVVLQIVEGVARGSTGHRYTRQQAWDALMGKHSDQQRDVKHAAPGDA